MGRIESQLPAHMFKTYAISQPATSHFRQATCAEVSCRAYLNGWATMVPTDSGQAAYIRGVSGRRFVEERQDGNLSKFVFEPGQECFAAAGHRISLEREPLYIVRGGDRRGNPSGERRIHTRAEDWRDDFSEHQLKIQESRG